MKKKTKIALLGAGSFSAGWAYALAAFEKIEMFEHQPAHARLMQKERKSLHLHGVTLPENVYVSSSLGRVLRDADLILVAVPSTAVEDVMAKAQKHIKSGQPIVICSKGFASNQRLLTDAVEEMFPANDVFCLSGPNLAREMVEGKITAATLAGERGEDVKGMLESHALIIELSDDAIGVQIGGALKNVVTMLLGVAEGAGFGQNETSFLFVRGIQEIVRVGDSFGALPETFYGLSCLGDLHLRSRNREVGFRLGKGEKLSAILKTIDYHPEGLITVEAAHVFAKHHRLEVPIIDCLYGIIKKKNDSHEAITNLFEMLRV